MAVTYGFYNALNHDRLYDAIQMSSIFDGIIRDGIFSTIGDCMVVSAPEDGLYVNVGSGRAWFNHTWTLNDTDYPIEAEEAEVVLDRIDAVILEVNSSAEVRANSIKFLKGTPSSEPVKPTLTHNAEVNQYALAYVTIRAGQTTIFQSDIENAVGTDETPFITGLLQQVSIETLLTQWESEFNTYFTNFQNTSTSEFNTWLASKVAEYTLWYAQMQTDMDADFAEFDAWFQRMKDQLSEDAAGHLQAEIDELAEAAQKGSIVTVTTTDPTLFNRPVTISQTGFDPVTSTFDATGVAYFETVPMVGEVAITATNGTLTAHGTLTIPYFSRYETTLEFWEAVIDISTNLQALYNRQITVTDSEETVVGTTTFDGTGHAEFSVHEAGTYTVSATDSTSYTYEEEVTVTEETTYYIELGSIPDGATVLPTDDIRTWLLCASERDVAYTTLAEVLADPELLGRLCADRNACDYMARSTTWAKAEGLVPVMIDNTHPSGSCICDSNASGTEAYKAFDDNNSTNWSSNTSDTSGGKWIGYVFDTAKNICALDHYSSAGASQTVKVQYSDDGSTWQDTGTTYTITSTNGTEHINIEDSGSHRYWRVYLVSATAATRFATNTLQFYEAADITTDSTAMMIVGLYDYCTKKLMSNSTWLDALTKSEYYESVFDISVPKMTSNTAPSGTVSSPTANNSHPAWNAFDKDDSTYFGLSTPSYTGWVQYDFGSKKNILAFSYYITSGTPKAMELEIKYSDDNSIFYSAGTYRYEDVDVNYHKVFKLNDNYGAHRYWRLIRTLDDHSTNWYTVASTLQFYGRTPKEIIYLPLVPAMTSNTTPSGEASASSEMSGYPAFKAFNDSSSNGWVPSTAANQWLQYHLPNSETAKRVAFYMDLTDTNRKPTSNFYIQGSNDGTNFTTLLTVTPSQVTGALQYFDINNDTAYDYYRISNLNSSWGCSLRIVQFYKEDTDYVAIHSAPNDTIYYMDGEDPVTVATTDSNGIALIDLSDLDIGTHVLYSTVAKNPDSLSNAYSKGIKITRYTDEIYLMPITALYWWGYNRCIQTVNAANGWPLPSSAYSYTNPTYRTNSIFINPNANPQICAIGSSKSFNRITKGYCVGNKSYASNEYALAGFSLVIDKRFSANPWNISSSPQKYSYSGTYGTYYYLEVGAYYNSQTTVYALWFE